MAASVAPGLEAPTFTLPDQDGNPVSLDDVLKSGPAIVFFYPKDETPGCTAEACSFRDEHARIAGKGATVLGISSDTVDSHKKFAAHHELPYRVLSDADGAVRKAWGVPRGMMGLAPGRVTYVVDQQRVVQHMYDSMFAGRHVIEAVEAIDKLKAQASQQQWRAESRIRRLALRTNCEPGT